MTDRAAAAAAGLLATLTSSALAALLATMPPLPQGRSLAAIDRWWVEVGTGPAAMTLVQLTAVGFAAWITLGALVDLAARLHPNAVVLGLRRCLWPSLLRRLVGSIVVLTSAWPAAHAGAGDPAPVPDDLVLVDIGSVPPTTGDISPAGTTLRLSDVGEVAGPAPLDSWTVQRGDHLWHIARETVADRGGDGSEAEVAAYWRRLLAANRDVVGADPDLIHPGQVVRLPD